MKTFEQVQKQRAKELLRDMKASRNYNLLNQKVNAMNDLERLTKRIDRLFEIVSSLTRECEHELNNHCIDDRDLSTTERLIEDYEIDKDEGKI